MNFLKTIWKTLIDKWDTIQERRAILIGLTIQLSRVLPDLVLSGFLLAFYLYGSYLNYSAPIQLIALKGILTSMGFLHSHIVQTLTLGEVNWRNDENKFQKICSICLYLIFVFSYAQAG